MLDLIHDHMILAGCIACAIVGAFWLAVEFWRAPIIEDGDARFYGES